MNVRSQNFQAVQLCSYICGYRSYAFKFFIRNALCRCSCIGIFHQL